jgi:site-specific DNA-methyltransferase (adenine-specific)
MVELLNIDCREYLKSVGDGYFDLFIQDTPFGVTQNDWDIKPDFKTLWPEWLRTGKENAAYLFFGTQPFCCDLIMSMPQLFRYDLIWYKALGSGFLNAKKMPLRNHESVLVFYRKLPTYNPQMGIGIRKKGRAKNDRTNSNYGKFGGEDKYHLFDDKGTRYPQSVLDFTNGDRTTDSDHPTQKPVNLIRYLIRTFSNEGDNVFDGYSGSGTTAVASYLENRNAVVCENKIEYYNQSVKRYKKEIKQQKLFSCDCA